jgi:hypothetical protein
MQTTCTRKCEAKSLACLMLLQELFSPPDIARSALRNFVPPVNMGRDELSRMASVFARAVGGTRVGLPPPPPPQLLQQQEQEQEQ